MALSFQALDPSNGKFEANVALRVVEAKNLTQVHDFNLKHLRDSYVVIALDQEEIFRTTTVEQSLSPFFGEDYNFRIPGDFSRLTFYVCDPSVHKDSYLGKVTITYKELLAIPARHEQWYSLLPVDADSEVQGKLHVAINLEDLQVTEGAQTQTQLVIKVLEAEGLSGWGSYGCLEPYCMVSLLTNAPGQKSEVKRGSTHKKTSELNFQEIFKFFIKEPLSLLNAIIRVSLWHEPLLGDRIFLGQVNLSISSMKILPLTHDGWHWLCPRPLPPGKVNMPTDLGSLRIAMHLSQDVIFPVAVYDPLLQLLVRGLDSPMLLPDTALFILGEVHKDWSAMACCLVHIFFTLNKLEKLIMTLIQHEVDVTSDANTLFRGNSLASKVIDEFMKMVGKLYLQRTLQCCIDEIFEVRRQCEIDTSRLSGADNRDVNMANLLFFVEKVLSAIFASARSCPHRMCHVFSMLREAAVAKFSGKEDTVCYTAVSGFIFLRFFAPAILNPKLFHLRPEFPCSVVARTLTLISKSIQSLGNMGGSKLTSLQHKESFMTQLQIELSDHNDDIKSYLQAISCPRGGEASSPEDMVYKEGMLIKRSQGRRKSSKNFRRRFFCLTNLGLVYMKAKAEPPLCTISAEEMLAVERVDETAFGMKFMFQLVQPGRILYMQASNRLDQLEWLTALSSVCSCNVSQTLIHTGAFINATWTCCASSLPDTSTGCRPVSLAIKLLAQHGDMDLERELHKVFKMFCENQAKLIALKDKATCMAHKGVEQSSLSPRLTTLCEVLVFVKNMELASDTFLQARHLSSVPGSRQSPFSCSSGEALVIA